LPGFGESQIAGANLLMADLAADVAGLLDNLGIQIAAIAGHSMGGYVALAFARAYPRRVRGLGLVSSQALADTPETKAGRYKQAEDILAHGVREVADGMSVKMTANLGLQTKLKELILRQRPEGLAGALRAMAERPDSTPFLPEFDFPVAIVHGLADQLIPVERARAVKAAVKKGTLTEVEGAGHMPMMEAPQATAEALKVLK
jgi:3-oxoadipate enol-lactonase